jgi:rubrerythrin
MLDDLTLKGCIEFAITTEELGAENYSRLAEKFGDVPDIAQLFTRLAEDEQVHKQQFSELLTQAPQSGNNAQSAETDRYLKAMSHTIYFSRFHGPFKDIDTIRNREDALQKALEFEKATLGFYKAVEEVRGGSEQLTRIIEAERSHVVALMKALLVEGSEFRSLQDTWP